MAAVRAALPRRLGSPHRTAATRLHPRNLLFLIFNLFLFHFLKLLLLLLLLLLLQSLFL
jgi:hypothetical protein